MRRHLYSVYILASRSRRLYVGATGNLERRILEHRAGIRSGFASRYRINLLVWMEHTPNVSAAIAREKEIKGWNREKRLRLIEAENPGWRDLSVDWSSGAGE